MTIIGPLLFQVTMATNYTQKGTQLQPSNIKDMANEH